jgi:hypothetical protein
MIHRIRPVTLLTSFMVAIASCGGGSSGPPDKLSEALQDAIHRNCQKEFNCKSSYLPAMHNNETFEDAVHGATVDACTTSLKTLLLAGNGQDYFTKLDASVTAGRIAYNKDDFEACSKGFEALTCDQVFDQNGATATEPEVCNTAVMSQVATGGACTLDQDCAADNGCNATAHTCD